VSRGMSGYWRGKGPAKCIPFPRQSGARVALPLMATNGEMGQLTTRPAASPRPHPRTCPVGGERGEMGLQVMAMEQVPLPLAEFPANREAARKYPAGRKENRPRCQWSMPGKRKVKVALRRL
jgi:hypothetical protein